ncbi:PRD domain-containing protein [Clostridium sp. MSJ-4]|uniref:PRD domain-containing protein n=1 Tax=Clostridium simiarum TaxID=2841506 RepID=A0ABS6F1X9_9CLOT|nr:PTS sugar transporter subunit IIA [Clostridium simiarum]MBU5591593.1 PRD domain-containing protein [Clostridium simiarum]
MLDLNSRQKDLIKIMINEANYKAVNEYSNFLRVSPRTIYSDIKLINKCLQNFHMEIEKKPGLGIKLIGDAEKKMQVMEFLNNKVEDKNQYTIAERQLEIIRMLLVDEKIISYQKLADYFWVSKTSISNDMQLIQSMLNEKTVSIQSNKKGTKFIGSEIQKQYTLQRYTELLLKEKNVENEKSFLKYGPDILKKIYPVNIVEIVFEEVAHLEKTLNISLSYYYLKSLIITLIIFMFRLSKDNHIYSKKSFIFEEIKSLETYFVAQNTLESISSKLNINVNKGDIDYLNKQLLAYCIKPEVKNKDEAKKYEEIVTEAIKEMSQIMNVDLTQDKKLYDGLIFHLIPMIYRIRIGIRIENPLLSEIKEQYSVTLSATWYVISKLEKKLDITLTEDEVAFVMVHFQASIDRNAQVKKILIVCPTGIGSSELIANKIKRFLPAKDIIEVVPIRKIYENDINNVDLIISSVQLDISNKPIIYVSSLVSNEDLKNIYSIYADTFINDKKINLPSHKYEYKFKYINELIDEKFIFTNCDYTSKEECLDYMISCFEEEGLTYEGFKESILEREEIGSTSLDSAVAIPHALLATVKKSRLGIMTLKNYIKWGGKNINTIILISISEKDIKKVKNILSELYEIVESKERVENLFLHKNSKEIFEVLGGTELD